MKTCVRCGKTGIFLKLNEDGFCPTCQQYLDNYVVPLCKQFLESEEILSKTKNFETMLSRANFAIDIYSKIKKEFPLNFDPIEKMSGHQFTGEKVMEFIAQSAKVGGYMCKELEKSILETAYRGGSTTKAKAKKNFIEAFKDSGQHFNTDRWDLDKSFTDTFKRLEFENKIQKKKIGNRYEYFIGSFFVEGKQSTNSKT